MRFSRRWLLVVLAVVLAATGTVVFLRHRAPATAPVAAVALSTVAVQRRDLSTTRSLGGTLGYGSARPLTGHRTATVTWLPAAGTVVERGGQLYRADDQPVSLFYGRMPLFRVIQGEGLVGRDVRIIADNLTALGYRIGWQPRPGTLIHRRVPDTGTPAKGGATEGVPDPTAGGGSAGGDAAGGDAAGGSPAGGDATGDAAEDAAVRTRDQSTRVRDGDGVLTASLIQAVKRWQRANDLPVTGRIAVGDVEVLSGAVRVDSVAVQTGAGADDVLMSVSSTRKVITVAAELADSATIRRGGAVGVVLPDDRTVKGHVLSVGRDLKSETDGAGTDPPKLTVTITVDDPTAVAKLDSAEVRVEFTGQTAKDVLTVPVEALVALSEGGYAVQKAGGLVAVETGMFADGLVEVSGDGLAEGDQVVVAS